MKKIFLSCMLAIAALTLQAQDATIGFSNGACGNNYKFRRGIGNTQGIAIKIGKEKLHLLKGTSISAVENVFGALTTKGKKARMFITTDTGGAALYEQDIEVTETNVWHRTALDTPYTITGDEEALYIGYTADVPITSYILSSDMSADTKGCSYVYDNGKWTDLYGSRRGNANIRCVIDKALQFSDLMLKTFETDGYFKAGTPYKYSGQLFNFGTETVNSFDITVGTGNGTPMKISYTDTNIASGQTYDFVLPDYITENEGDTRMSLEISNVNGGDDSDMSDNTVTANTFFYPKDMERSLLLEGFTGQTCSNCPSGHAALQEAIDKTDMDIIEVMHHSGYYPDIFTMKEDIDYTWFYSGSTYAPAFMVNRTKTKGSSPVMETRRSDAELAFNELAKQQPYVSMKLESEYNPATREVKVRLMTYANRDLPTASNRVNVVLTQDGITAIQSGGGNTYKHNHVFRGALTEDTWGVALPEIFKRGDTHTWEKTFTLPEAIRSSHWTDEELASSKYNEETVTIATDPENMHIVAYTAAHNTKSNSDCQIYNCVQVSLGNSHTQGGITSGIGNAMNENFSIRVSDGRIHVEGCYDNYAVYNISGTRMPADTQPGSGVYIVRVVGNGKATSKKIIIR